MNSEDSGLRLFRWIRVARKRVVVVVVVVVARSPCVSPTRDSCNAASFRSECLLQDRTLQLLQMVLGSCCAALRESKLSFDREEDFGKNSSRVREEELDEVFAFSNTHTTLGSVAVFAPSNSSFFSSDEFNAFCNVCLLLFSFWLLPRK